MERRDREAALVWAVFIAPPVLIMLAWGASAFVDFSSFPVALIFTALWGIAACAVSLRTGQFIYRPIDGHTVAEVAHGAEHPWAFRFYIAGFAAMAVWAVGKLLYTAI